MNLQKTLIIIRLLTIIALSIIIGLNIFNIYTYKQLRPILLSTTILYSISYIIILKLSRKRK